MIAFEKTSARRSTKNLADLETLRLDAVEAAKALMQGDDRQKKIAKRIMGCQNVFHIDKNGKPFLRHRCRSRWCNVCAAAYSEKEYACMRAVETLVDTNKYCLVYAIMTASHPLVTDTKLQVSLFKAAVKRIEKIISAVGSYQSFEWVPELETTHLDGLSRVNVHLNLVYLVPRSCASTFRFELEAAVNKASSEKFQPYVQCCKPIAKGEACTVVGYSTKDTPSAYDDGYTCILEDQLFGVNKIQSTGLLKKYRAAAEAAYKIAKIPKPLVPAVFEGKIDDATDTVIVKASDGATVMGWTPYDSSMKKVVWDQLQSIANTGLHPWPISPMQTSVIGAAG